MEDVRFNRKEPQLRLFSASKVMTNNSLIVFIILACSSCGGIGTNFGLTIGTVNCGMLDPVPVSNNRLNTQSRNSKDIKENGVIVINLIIG